MMEARAFLSQAKDLELLVQAKQDHIEYLHEMATRISMWVGSEPVKHSRNNQVMQNALLKAVEAEYELGEVMAEIIQKRMEISRVIDLVDDLSLRNLLERHYLKYEEWNDIAKEIGQTSRNLRIKHAIAVQKVQYILDNYADFAQKSG